MASLINRNQGVLALISFLATFALIIVWVTTVRADISNIDGNIKKQTQILGTMSDYLKDGARDHNDFIKTADETNKVLNKMSEAFIKLDNTLNRLELRIEMMNPRPLRKQLKD